MQRMVTFLAASLLVAAADHAVNYCGSKMCSHGNSHTFCQYPPGPSPSCIGYMESKLTMDEKVRILSRLNRRRSEAANGRLKNTPTAGNMLKLRWVEELAREAQRWADQCRPPRTPEEKDTCRDLYSISVGQCVASVVGEAPGLRVESMVDLWYMQNMLYKGNITFYVQPVSSVNYYGDFAQMVWARSYMVGCGRSRFMTKWDGRVRSVERLVCNIAPRGPASGRALWSPAPPAASCPPRALPDHGLPGLCNFHADFHESSDVKGAMSLPEHVLLNTVLEIENNEALNYLGSLDEMYLTKLAIVTMENSVTESLMFNNSVRKRDIIEASKYNNTVPKENNATSNVNVLQINGTILSNANQTSTMKSQVKKDNKIIGRPKTYHLDDLYDVSGEQTTQESINANTLEKDSQKIDRDLYLDYYENIDSITTLVSTTTVAKLTKKNTQTQAKSLNQTTKKIIIPLSTVKINVTTTKLNKDGSSNTTVVTATKKINSTVNETVTIKSEEDYLTDPETVQEIQDALERMERSLEEPPQVLHKVRRELRDTPTPSIEDAENDDTNKNEDLDDSSQINTYNTSSDRSPMLNMVLKYLPYLKPYEKEILGESKSCCSVIGSTITVYILEILFLFCFKM